MTLSIIGFLALTTVSVFSCVGAEPLSENENE